ncbi:protein kinase C-binding protein NELL2-like [Mytilus edulis]|uniref:protein kinase C-binding protein NELL2-like n=1 Tax=Mytilus edulis TaxID=6550 RepID=UPI0039EEB8F4
MHITKAWIICTVGLFLTVTLSIAAVYTTVALMSIPQDNSSVTTTTTNNITEPSCFDKLNTCGDFPNDACLGIFHTWALENCPRRCGLCNSLFTTTQKGCHDKHPEICRSQKDIICSNDANYIWARGNCQKTCHLCPGHIRTTPTPKGCTFNGVSYQHNAHWTNGCDKNCTCVNGLYSCVFLCPIYPNLPPNWQLVGKSARCCHPHYVIGVGKPICNYGGKEYKQDETWSDGCQFSCICNDAKAGQYQCKELCPKWDLPDVCHWNPASAGKCCSQPECPLPYVIKGYPDL